MVDIAAVTKLAPYHEYVLQGSVKEEYRESLLHRSLKCYFLIKWSFFYMYEGVLILCFHL